MDIIGIDISKAKFDIALLTGERTRHAVFSNTEAGFSQLLAWMVKHRSDPDVPLHACMVEAVLRRRRIDLHAADRIGRHRRGYSLGSLAPAAAASSVAGAVTVLMLVRDNSPGRDGSPAR